MSEQADIEKEAEKFRLWLEGKTSPATGRMYSSYIKRLRQPVDLEAQDAEEIKAELEDKVTTSPVRSAFKKYLTYLNQTQGYGKQKSMELDWLKNQLDQFEVSGSRNLNKSEVLDEYLTTAEIQTLLDHITKQTNRGYFKSEKEFDQFRILPLLMFETGARVSEMIGKQQDPDHVGLKVSNIDFSENKITILDAKYGKNRTADFQLSEDLLRSYLEKHGIESGQVFDIDYHRFLRKLKMESQEALNREVATHAFRHSFATNWVIQRSEEGESWASAKEKVNAYLDHEDMKTTEAYIDAAQELVRKNIYEEYGSFSISVEAKV